MSAMDDDAAAIERVRQLQIDEEYARKVWQRDNDRRQRRAEERRQQFFGGVQQGPDGMIVPPSLPVNGVGDGHGPVRQDGAQPYNPFRDPALVNVTDNGVAPTDRVASVAPNASRPSPIPPTQDEERQWNTKEIFWRGRAQRVVVQNENGPCSLIALCNILLLRGVLAITPEDRPAVSYSYLSSLLGEHVIDAITAKSDAALDLEAALSILPQMQSGLDVNVRFSSIHGFAGQETSNDHTDEIASAVNLIDLGEPGPSSAAQPPAAVAHPTAPTANSGRGELALFKVCGVPLVHGWLADQDDEETWNAVAVRAGDYDAALDRIVAGDELTKGSLGGETVDASAALGGSSSSTFDRLAVVVASLPDDQKRTVNDALLIRRFLESTATQLTYPGLHALSTTLTRGQLYALFRNSHLSVLYRPTEEELAAAAAEDQPAATFNHAQPQLYQLVTDATLEIEDGIVWESVEDVDGSASRFFDGKFRPAQLQADFVGHSEEAGGRVADQDADFAYAQHLQQQEDMRLERHRLQQQHRRSVANGRQHCRKNSGRPNDEGQGGGLIARMLAKRKSSKSAPTPQTLDANVSSVIAGRPASGDRRSPSTALVSFAEPGTQDGAPAPETTTGTKKWWKKVL